MTDSNSNIHSDLKTNLATLLYLALRRPNIPIIIMNFRNIGETVGKHGTP